MNEIKAYDIIKKYKNIKLYNGIYVIPNNFKEPKELNEALNYMFNEWDYMVLTTKDYIKESVKNSKTVEEFLKKCKDRKNPLAFPTDSSARRAYELIKK